MEFCSRFAEMIVPSEPCRNMRKLHLRRGKLPVSFRDAQVLSHYMTLRCTKQSQVKRPQRSRR